MVLGALSSPVVAQISPQLSWTSGISSYGAAGHTLQRSQLLSLSIFPASYRVGIGALHLDPYVRGSYLHSEFAVESGRIQEQRRFSHTGLSVSGGLRVVTPIGRRWTWTILRAGIGAGLGQSERQSQTPQTFSRSRVNDVGSISADCETGIAYAFARRASVGIGLHHMWLDTRSELGTTASFRRQSTSSGSMELLDQVPPEDAFHLPSRHGIHSQVLGLAISLSVLSGDVSP